MAYEVQKLVLYRTADAKLTLEDLVAVFTADKTFDIRASGLFVYVRNDDDVSSPAVRLSMAEGSEILADSIVIAERHAAGRPDRAQIAACDARIEVAWKADESDDVIDIVLALTTDLEELTSGVTWFSNVKELSDGSLRPPPA
jgi:hypothetical protein